MSELTVEYDSAKPETIAIRSARDQSLDGLDVPAAAIKFHFTRTEKGRLPKIVSPFYFLTAEPLVLTAEPLVLTAAEALAKRPQDARSVRLWQQDYDASEFGVVAWHEGPAIRSMLIPLTPEIVLLERTTMRQVWPRKTAGVR